MVCEPRYPLPSRLSSAWPPGTGKSSLSLALAGYFKMRIYILSLSSPMSSEETVSSLFASLPRKCVVLLEDIDSAGLTHTRDKNSDTTESSNDENKTNGTATNTTTGKLSLSGLLNILDGVASQEGRVLIMTTNHIEKLDKALIRPGRVDMTVLFGRADNKMASAIFRSIYAPHEGEDIPVYDDRVADPTDDKAANREEALERIKELSHEFAAKIPEHEFSPAEIQGLLLRHKRHPLAALNATDDWIVQTRKEKEDQAAEEKKKEEEEKKKKEEEEKKKKEEEEKTKKEEEEKKQKEEEEKEEKKKKKKEKKKKEEEEEAPEDEDEDEEDEDEEKKKKRKKADAKKRKEKKAELEVGDKDKKTQKESSDSGYITP
uniref:AAA+ ATPase domain-containing protein n=1 Tax=Bionectria ochroleuca TaxID=29856 RepID=A0A8H7TN77_BIOOC